MASDHKAVELGEALINKFFLRKVVDLNEKFSCYYRHFINNRVKKEE